MPLSTGTRLGRYEIIAAIGAGGMGEVYRARDTRLGRDVAIKVLPAAFSSDPDRLQRFEREARTIAALNHPHICTLHDVGHDGGIHFIVMEYLEGKTLAQRLARGPLSVDEALAVAIQIADALAAAHRAGIVHRDLKPGNIMLTKSGATLLDFGLARIDVPVSPGNLSVAPTAVQGLTILGGVVGTLQYMAPEQIDGREADARADIYAFGCVLYEMLMGKRPAPDYTTIKPAWLDTIIRRCSDADPDSRWQSARDVGIALTMGRSLGASEGRAASSRWPALILAAVAGIALVLVAAASVRRADAPTAVRRFAVDLEGELVAGRSGLAISPNATHIVYSANQQLYVRAMDQLAPIAIADTVGAQNSFFSPDGQWIGFWQNNRLKKVRVSGGATFELCRAPNPIGVSWTATGMILFGTPDGIYEVSSEGGQPQRIIRIDPQKEVANGPRMLPDGRTILFAVASLASGRLSEDLWDNAQIVTQAIGSKERKVIAQGGRDPRYLPTGHLVYLRHGALLALPFNSKTLTTTGSPIQVVDGIQQGVGGVSFGSVTGSNTQLSISDNGVLAYVPVDRNALSRTLTWVDRQGRESPLPVPNRAYVYPRISPNGQRVALDIRDEERDIWVWDFERETFTRLTFDPAADTFPVWTHDGRRLFWSRVGEGIVVQDAGGAGSAERILSSGLTVMSPESLSPDGTRLVFSVSTAQSYDLKILNLATKQVEGAVLARPDVNELNGDISPDGRWLAYASDESGHYQVYVRPFPDVIAGKWQVSEGGGTRPQWSPTGKELFYLAPPEGMPAMEAVKIDTAAGFRAGNSGKLFSGPYLTALVGRTYDLSRDGQRFLMVRAGTSPAGSGLPKAVVIENWFEELKRLVPATN